MAYQLKLPDIGEGLLEAEVISWLVDVGDEVTSNQPLVEVETDKAVVEIPSPQAGVLLHQGADAGQVIEVGRLLAVIGEPGEVWAADDVSAAEDEPRAAQSSELEPPAAPSKAMPLVRKLAKELGVDLAVVTGTGASGQITREDVHVAASAVPPERAIAAQTLSKLRRTIAGHMARSWEEIPHVTVWGPAEANRLLNARKRTRFPLEALLIHTVRPVLAEFPDFSSHFDGQKLEHIGSPSIGIAADTDAGLLVPVVKNTAELSLDDLAKEIARLIEDARSRTLSADQLRGQSFTITNLGAVGGGYGTPIIPHGTTAILSVGLAKDEVIARYGQPVVAPVFPLALSFDHRVIDGAQASRFLNRVTAEIELFR